MIGGAVALLGVWINDRRVTAKENNTNRLDLTKVTLEAEVKREDLLNKATAAMFDRLQEEIDDLKESQSDRDSVIADLRERVRHLEDNERRMIAWMAMNKVPWPPPQDVADSL